MTAKESLSERKGVHLRLQLRRKPRNEPYAALLLRSHNTAALLELSRPLVRCGVPTIYPVADGFLLVLEDVTEELFPNTIRLRRLGENFYIPVDAELFPALLPEERLTLTRSAGLVLLPGGRCLRFDLDQTLSLVHLLCWPVLRREDWSSFPTGLVQADRLRQIARSTPETPLAMLDSGGEGIGQEEPRPPEVGPIKHMVGRIRYGLGKLLGGMGIALGMGQIARVGAALMGRAIASVPRLSEQLLGKQEAALRELLKLFREGRTEEALRHALPVGREGGRGGSVYAGDQLPTHDPRYSLANLIGQSSGAENWWIGGQDLQKQLIEEYRRVAREALQRGDFRRAAYIHGNLLGDLNTAANILAEGGLHRDAAILYRDALNAPRRAAGEFELAGESDEALRLYRSIPDHEAAGDLLQRLGDEEAAVMAYQQAADEIVRERHDYLKAGDLLIQKTARPELAVPYFLEGWETRRRHLAGALSCAIRLMEIYALAEPLDPFWKLLAEVEAWHEPAGNVTLSAEFFNRVASLADKPHLRTHRLAIRDRCRVALAKTMRRVATYEQRMGSLVSTLFVSGNNWSPALVSDATYALKQHFNAQAQAAKVERSYSIVRVGEGMVVSFAEISHQGEGLIGFADGRVVCFRPRTEQVIVLPHGNEGAPVGIAANYNGETVVVLWKTSQGKHCLQSYALSRSQTYHVRALQPIAEAAPVMHLLPYLVHLQELGASAAVQIPGHSLQWFDSPGLIPRGEPPVPVSFAEKEHLWIYPHRGGKTPVLLCLTGKRVTFGSTTIELVWEPDYPPGTSLHAPPLAWYDGGPSVFELAGITQEGVIYWTSLRHENDTLFEERTYASRRPRGYRAVTIWKPGYVVGVTTDNRVTWLRAGTIGFHEAAPTTRLHHPSPAVTCFTNFSTRELFVVVQDGEIIRIPIPV